MNDLSDRFFYDAAKIEKLDDSATHISYREFVTFFDSKENLSKHDIVIGAYFTYGWMPTMLELRGDLDQVTKIANRVKRKQTISEGELNCVAVAINGSIVGASKFLHFVSPTEHAIWDSRVYRYIYRQNPYQNRLKLPGIYKESHLSRLKAQ